MKENIDNDEKMMPFRVHDPILESYRIMPSHRLWPLCGPRTSDLVIPTLSRLCCIVLNSGSTKSNWQQERRTSDCVFRGRKLNSVCIYVYSDI